MNRLSTGLLTMAALFCAGCSSTPPADRYYSLVLDAAETVTAKTDDDAMTRVDLGDVRLPAFLESRSMVMQVGGNEVQVANRHFWAEPLDEAIARVVILDIAEQTTGISVAMDDPANHDCDLRIDFDRFHASDDARVLVSGRYRLTSDAGSNNADFDYSQSLRSGGYGSAVSALRESLRSLSRDVGEVIGESEICARPAVAAEQE